MKHHLSCIFCEDIRHEVGGKVSLMGCFHKMLKIPSVPFEIAKLCVQISIVLDDDTELNDASVSLLLNGKEKAGYSFEKGNIEISDDHDPKSAFNIIAGLNIPRFNIDETGTIDVLVSVNGLTQKAGSLKIVSSAEPAIAPTPKKPPTKPASRPDAKKKNKSSSPPR